MIHDKITEKIIKAYYTVYNTLGYGFLEKVYENALAIELQKNGFLVTKQQNIDVFYEGHLVGDYFADILVDGLIILELKAAEAICEEHKFQLINYLKATDKEVGLLMNFGKKPEFERVIFMNYNKKPMKKSAVIC